MICALGGGGIMSFSGFGMRGMGGLKGLADLAGSRICWCCGY